MGLFDRSSSKKETTNNYTDNRVVNDAGGGIIGTGNTISISDPSAELFQLSAANSVRAWEHTLDASEKLISGLISSTSDGAKASQAVAAGAITAFTPTDNKSADALKWALFAGVAVVALLILRK